MNFISLRYPAVTLLFLIVLLGFYPAANAQAQGAQQQEVKLPDDPGTVFPSVVVENRFTQFKPQKPHVDNEPFIAPEWKTKTFMIPQAIAFGSSMVYAHSSFEEAKHNCARRTPAPMPSETISIGARFVNSFVLFVISSGLEESHSKKAHFIEHALIVTDTALNVANTIRDRSSCW